MSKQQKKKRKPSAKKLKHNQTIDGADVVEVTNDGLSVTRDGRFLLYGQEMTTEQDKRGYHYVEWRDRGWYLHEQVAKHFIHNTSGYLIITHKDGDLNNNAADNLHWED